MDEANPAQARPPREPIFNISPAVSAIAGILIVLHVLRFFLLGDEANWALIENLGFVPARIMALFQAGTFSIENLALSLASFLTYSLLHGDIFHLGFNCVWLIALGTPVERRLGARRLVAFWIICTILSALFYGLMRLHGALPVIGASGAISGLMGGLVRIIFAKYERYGAGLSRLTDRRLIGFAVVWIGFNAIIGSLGLGGPGAEAIAWEAHVGGFLAGLLIFPLFDPARRAARAAERGDTIRRGPGLG